MNAVSKPPPAIRILRFVPAVPPLWAPAPSAAAGDKPAPTAAVPSTDETRNSLLFIAILSSAVAPTRVGPAVRRNYTAPMRSSSALRAALFFLVAPALLSPLAAAAPPDWSRFRGPNGSGI